MLPNFRDFDHIGEVRGALRNILAAVRAHKLAALDLSDCDLHQDHVENLATALPKLELTSLNLGGNQS